MRIKNLSMSLPKHDQPIQVTNSQSMKNNYNLIVQKWETKKDIPKELEAYIHLPIFVDKEKFFNRNSSELPQINKDYLTRQS